MLNGTGGQPGDLLATSSKVVFFSIRFEKITAGGAMPSWLTLWKCTACCIHMVKTVLPCRGHGVRDPTTKRKKKKKRTDRNGWMPSSLSKGLQGRRENTSLNRRSALMRWFFASSKEKVSLAGNGAKSSSPEGGRTSGRGTASTSSGLALLLLLLRLLDNFFRLVVAVVAEPNSRSASSS